MRQILFLLLLPFALWARTPSMAVDELVSRGVSRNDAAIISDRLREALVQTGKVRVLEREEMAKILKEQAFQQSGACDQSECAVKIGRLLAVDRMVVGTVGRIGNLYTLGARLLDVGTGEVLFTASRDNEGALEDLLLVAVPEIAERLAEGAQRTAKGKISGGGKADLEVTIDDTSAVLLLDGRAVPGKGRFFLEGIEAGNHRLDARTSTRQGFSLVELEDDAVEKIEIYLDTGRTPAKFYSEPSRAEVYLDGNEFAPAGVTPFRLDSLVVGRHAVTFRKQGFVDTTISVDATLGATSSTRMRLARGAALILIPAPNVPVTLVRGRDTIRTAGVERIPLREGRWRFALKHPDWEPMESVLDIRSGDDDTLWPTRHFASLRIRSMASATVYLDGDSLGTTPLDLDDVEPGFRTILLRAEGKTDWSQQLHLHSGETIRLDSRMESRFASLGVRSNVPAMLAIDGVPMGALVSDSARLANSDRAHVFVSGTVTPSRPPRTLSWNSDTLAPGVHRLQVYADRRVPWETNVNLANGAEMSFDVLLPWTAEELAKRDHRVRVALRYPLGAFTALAVGATSIFIYRWNADLDRAGRIQAEYDAARSGFPEIKSRYASAQSDVQGDRSMAVVSGALAMVFATGLCLTWTY